MSQPTHSPAKLVQKQITMASMAKDDHHKIRMRSKNKLGQAYAFADELEGKNHQNLLAKSLQSMTQPNWTLIPICLTRRDYVQKWGYKGV